MQPRDVSAAADGVIACLLLASTGIAAWILGAYLLSPHQDQRCLPKRP
jgi:hypothetical protein